MTRRDIPMVLDLTKVGEVSSAVVDGAMDWYADMAAWPPIRTTAVSWTVPQWWFTLSVLPLLGAAPDPRRHFTIGGTPLRGALDVCARRLAGGVR
ncbi:hypothetical protein [Tsukamurella tyrosinosolvens]|uniref:hypothetical protein n=1 Tax=Tsukamurella tyrosinosolvens TaxID=57704 RepID=UPI002DD42C54|nr:hypothetical protein [Tsukamurella tyrosinosolvens]MEC4616271.1 hypothetical protein [Tsukamurella tyrosinosolvens]